MQLVLRLILLWLLILIIIFLNLNIIIIGIVVVIDETVDSGGDGGWGLDAIGAYSGGSLAWVV